MKRILMPVLFLVLLTLSFSIEGGKHKSNPAVSASDIQAHINYLASDELKGRLTGSEGAQKAADYIREQFQSYGLEPLFRKSYYQEFPFISGVEMTGNNTVSFSINGSEKTLTADEQFVTVPFSDNEDVKGELVFAGYGISAPELNYDDYTGIDINGKIAVIMRYNPDIENPHSKYDKYSDLRLKAKTAKDKGAAGVIFVSGFIPKDDEDKLVKLRYDGAPAAKSIAAVHVKRDVINEIFKAEGLNFEESQKKINQTKRPASFLLKNITATLKTGIKKIEKAGINVACVLRGSDPKLKDEYIVVGAHYDHLGMGQTGSLYKGAEPKIHNGADDNASGTAGVLEAAEKLASIKGEMKRSIIFIAFAGEEEGLLGSNYFVQNSPVPLNNIVAMLNMDMIGRMNDENNLIIQGSGTSSVWKGLLNRLNSTYNFKLSLNDDGYGGSDQTSFLNKDIPVLFFFTGIHSDYHRPSDKADKIKADKEEKIVDYVLDVAEYVDTVNVQPDFVKVARKDKGGVMSFKVYVGTIPDYTWQSDGFKITGVSEGSPAQKAGLKGGDIIVQFGSKKVDNIYDYMYALGNYAPGDVVDVTVKRGSEQVTLKVTMAAR